MLLLNPDNKQATYAYVTEVTKDGVVSKVQILANTRAQAGAIAKRHGFLVNNMYIG